MFENPGGGSRTATGDNDRRVSLPNPITDTLTAVGLGLDYGADELGPTTEEWLNAGGELRDRVEEVLGDLAAGVELVGSSSVLDLLAKPIIDLAVGLSAEHSVTPVKARLQADGWIYRGDAGDDGGRVFVLEARPWHRVAHLHVVKDHGSQWLNYLRFRDLLRRSADVRTQYAAVKLQLAHQGLTEAKAYTAGKNEIVASLLSTAKIASSPSSTAQALTTSCRQ